MEISKDKRTNILAIDRTYLQDWVGMPEGYNQCGTYIFAHDSVAGALAIRRRHELEKNPAYMQILPYITIMQKGEDGITPVWFTYQRTKKIGEDRLAGKFSIGLGGHVDLEDIRFNDNNEVDILDTIAANLIRELNEELVFTDPTGKEVTAILQGTGEEEDDSVIEIEARMLGMITEYSDEIVGKYHVGVHFLVHLEDNYKIKIREEELVDHGFQTMEALSELGLENWSRLIVSKNVPKKETDVEKSLNTMLGYTDKMAEVRNSVLDKTGVPTTVTELGASVEACLASENIPTEDALVFQGLRYRVMQNTTGSSNIPTEVAIPFKYFANTLEATCREKGEGTYFCPLYLPTSQNNLYLNDGCGRTVQLNNKPDSETLEMAVTAKGNGDTFIGNVSLKFQHQMQSCYDSLATLLVKFLDPVRRVTDEESEVTNFINGLTNCSENDWVLNSVVDIADTKSTTNVD